jgi:hypothetical protein
MEIPQMNCHPDRSAKRAVEGPAVPWTNIPINRKTRLFIGVEAEESAVFPAVSNDYWRFVV